MCGKTDESHDSFVSQTLQFFFIQVRLVNRDMNNNSNRIMNQIGCHIVNLL